MKDITKDNNEWNKKMQIELSLRELQIIYDCVGEMSGSELKNIHIHDTEPYLGLDEYHLSYLLSDIYEYLNSMIINYGGIEHESIH